MRLTAQSPRRVRNWAGSASLICLSRNGRAVRLVVATADERHLVEGGEVTIDHEAGPVVVDRQEHDSQGRHLNAGIQPGKAALRLSAGWFGLEVVVWI